MAPARPSSAVIVLLPPSETKRDGGADELTLELGALSFPTLTPPRRAAVAGLRRLCRNVDGALAGLGIGRALRFEVDRNRALGSSPVMPAIDRYAGVLYDALGAAELGTDGRRFLAQQVVVHSALFGLLRAGDLIPAYRMSHDSRLPGIRLKALWRRPIEGVLGEHRGLILDLRSEAYLELGPPPAGSNAFFLRVVSDSADGRKRALNHFNKKGKGEFLRALAEDAAVHDDVDSLLHWAAGRGIRLVPGAPGELELTV